MPFKKRYKYLPEFNTEIKVAVNLFCKSSIEKYRGRSGLNIFPEVGMHLNLYNFCNSRNGLSIAKPAVSITLPTSDSRLTTHDLV